MGAFLFPQNTSAARTMQCAGLVLARAHHYLLCCWSNVLLVLVPLVPLEL